MCYFLVRVLVVSTGAFSQKYIENLPNRVRVADNGLHLLLRGNRSSSKQSHNQIMYCNTTTSCMVYAVNVSVIVLIAIEN